MIEHLSYSSINTYLSCSRYWRFKYLDKLPTPTNTALLFGSAWHAAIEKILTNAAARKNLENAWTKSWNETLEKNPAMDWGEDTPEELHNQGVRMITHADIQNGILSIKAGKDEQGARIERKVELRVPGVPVPVIGYVDIILEDGVPGDFKTSATRWSEDKALSAVQSLFYLASLNQMGIQTPGWRFRHYIFVKTKTPQFQMLEHVHQPGELFWMFEMIQQVWKGIEAEIFPANPGAWQCKPQACEFWSVCRGK